MDALVDTLRRVLNYRISIAGLIELALWLAIPHLLIGLTWAFFHVEQVRQINDRLDQILPAGAEVGAYVLAALLWPALLVLSPLCAA